MKRHLILAIFFIGSGCASGYSQFYQSVPNMLSNVLPAQAPPRVVPAARSPEETVNRMWEQGFAVVGYSNFNGPMTSQGSALTQAKKIGAEIVVIQTKYTDTREGAIPVTTQRAVTTYSQGTVSTYGTGGSNYGNYSGTSTSYVPQTTVIPFSIDRYDQTALYFARLKPPCVGVLMDELSPEEIKMLGTNKGGKVRAIRRDSPAFDADVLPDDIFLSVNGRPFTGFGDFHTDMVASVELYRQGKRISIPIRGGAGCGSS